MTATPAGALLLGADESRDAALPGDEHARLAAIGLRVLMSRMRPVAVSRTPSLDMREHSGHAMSEAMQKAALRLRLLLLDRAKGDDVSLSCARRSLSSGALAGLVLGHADSVSGRSHAHGR